MYYIINQSHIELSKSKGDVMTKLTPARYCPDCKTTAHVKLRDNCPYCGSTVPGISMKSNGPTRFELLKINKETVKQRNITIKNGRYVCLD